ncbi:MAG: hypothetical protein WAZ18_00800 [Alphaproteobacteria bacterium]
MALTQQQQVIAQIRAEGNALKAKRDALVAEQQAAHQAFVKAKQDYEALVTACKDAERNGNPKELAKLLRDLDVASQEVVTASDALVGLEPKVDAFSHEWDAFQAKSLALAQTLNVPAAALAQVVPVAPAVVQSAVIPVQTPAPTWAQRYPGVQSLANRFMASAPMQRVQANPMVQRVVPVASKAVAVALPLAQKAGAVAKPLASKAVSVATPWVVAAAAKVGLAEQGPNMEDLKQTLAAKEQDVGAKIADAEMALQRMEHTLTTLVGKTDDVLSKLDALLGKFDESLEKVGEEKAVAKSVGTSNEGNTKLKGHFITKSVKGSLKIALDNLPKNYIIEAWEEFKETNSNLAPESSLAKEKEVADTPSIPQTQVQEALVRVAESNEISSNTSLVVAGPRVDDDLPKIFRNKNVDQDTEVETTKIGDIKDGMRNPFRWGTRVLGGIGGAIFVREIVKTTLMLEPETRG